MNSRIDVVALGIVLAIIGTEHEARSESPPEWRLGGHANISVDGAGERGWLMGLGIGAKHRLSGYLDLQFRVLGTFRSQRWHDGVYVNPPGPSAGTTDGGHMLAEATTRLRPYGPAFMGLGAQAGVRVLGYDESASTWPYLLARTGNDVQPVVRALFELGGDFGPSEMFEVGLRVALGSTLGRGPVEGYFGTADGELGLTMGVLWPL